MKNTSAYNAREHEERIYTLWEQSGYFSPDNLPGERSEPFSVMMPPPNVTGVLHLGHALEQSLMDTKIRFERMRGKKVLLVPGTDHAAVATQARVEKDLVEGGIKNPRQVLGREKLLSHIREFAEEQKSTMLLQMRKLGASADWSRLAYTFDEARSKAVDEAFTRMYHDGLIYRGYRVVNWSVAGQSTASDDELVHIERPAKLYTMKYSADFPIPIATTRPETKLGDTAVAVHPDDKRYKQFIGKTFTVDVGAAKPLQIRIIADTIVDPEFGTGAVGVTPAHSMTDYELKERHNLEIIPVIGTDGRMTDNAGAYAGLPVVEAREKFISWLRDQNLIIKEEEIAQNIATSDRFHDVIEIVPMLQWFVAVNKEIPGRGKTLKDLMRKAGEDIEVKPERFKKVYYQWIDNLRDWCISRQIWWGHRIPVWYKKGTEELYVGVEPPVTGDWEQDPDTLDTWFSSGQWTFSTLGWPTAIVHGKKTGDLATFHPTSWMQMGYEIVFMWMSRMILMSTYLLDEIPFKEVYMHGLVRDKEGKKFSKSLRNVIDPLEVIEQHGTDALRLSLISGVTPGNDVTFDLTKVEHYQHFVNKLWNISRYILGSVADVKIVDSEPASQTFADQWILQQWRETHAHVTEKLSQSDFSLAAQRLYEFTWDSFADWYLEVAKIERKASDEASEVKDRILLYILRQLLITWHPFIPFVTEVLWEHIKGDNLLMIAVWPQQQTTSTEYEEGAVAFGRIQEVIRSVRDFRATNKVKAHEKVAYRTKLEFPEYREVIEVLARCTVIAGEGGASIATETATLTDRKRAELEGYVASLEAKLKNSSFTKNAPPAVVEAEQKKLKEAQAKLKQ